MQNKTDSAMPDRRFHFGLRSMFVLTAISALLCAAYRIHPALAALVVYAGGLILVMASYQWSDIAMSVCTILLVAGAVLAALVI